MSKEFSPLNLSDENDAWNKMALEISQEIRFGKRKATNEPTAGEKKESESTAKTNK